MGLKIEIENQAHGEREKSNQKRDTVPGNHNRSIEEINTSFNIYLNSVHISRKTFTRVVRAGNTFVPSTFVGGGF